MNHIRTFHATFCAIISILVTPLSLGQCIDWADGYADDQFGTNATVRAMLTRTENNQQVLYVAGDFSRIGGIDATGIARFDGSQWTRLGDGINSSVRDLVEFDDGNGIALYAAGTFMFDNGQEHTGVARWKDGVWSSAGADANGINTLAVHEGELYAAGEFDLINGETTENMAAWNGATWRTFSSGPSRRSGHSMTFDPTRGEVILFGGDEEPNGTEQQDTWSHDGEQWTLLAIDGPDRRDGHSMTFDTLRQRVLMFGGDIAGGVDTRLWGWNGSSWNVVADYLPLIRREMRIAYDQSRDRVIWFGGYSQSTVYHDETWEFDGAQWVEVIPATMRPSARANYAIAYDPQRDVTVLFGGYGYDTGAMGDTWEWDGVDWTLVSVNGPEPRYGQQMVYDSAAQHMVMFGGRTNAAQNTDTWAWDGISWTLLDSDPAHPHDGYGPMAYDPAADQVIMRDGRGVTWIWDGNDWTNINEGGPNGAVFDVASYDPGTGPELFVCGSFTLAGSVPASNIARITNDGWETVGGGVQGNWCNTLYLWDDGGGTDLYIGGPFSQADNRNIQGIGRWDGTEWSLLNVGFPNDGGGVIGTVRTIFAYDDGSGEKLYVGGDFDIADGPGFMSEDDIEVSNIARWDGSIWETVGVGIEEPGGSNRGVYALGNAVINGETRLFAGGSFDLSGGKPSANLAEWGIPCTPPLFVEHPEDVFAQELEPVIFAVRVAGTRPFAYQWRKEGQDLVNDGRITGATTDLLYIEPWLESDAGAYDVVVTSPLGSATSNPAGLTTLPGGNSGGIVTVETVMLVNDPSPWDENAFMHRVGAGTTSPDGFGVLWAESSENLIDAVLRWRDGEAVSVAKVDDPAPGTPAGTLFGGANRYLGYHAWIANNAEITLVATVSGDGINDDNDVGLWRDNGEELRYILREGEQAPGFAPGVLIDGDYEGNATFAAQPSPGDWLTFKGALKNGGFDPAFDRAVWQWSEATGASLLVQRGTPAPLIGTNILDFGWPTVTNTSGATLLNLGLESRTGYKVNPNGWDGALVLSTFGNWEYIAHSGDPAPGYPSEVNIDAIGNGYDIRFNDSGDIVFECRVAGPDNFRSEVLYTWSESQLRPVVKTNDPAPGVPESPPILDAELHAVNNTGDIVFSAVIEDENCNQNCIRSGLFIESGGQLSNIAYQQMTPIPGLSDAFAYDGTSRSAINDESQLIFGAGIRLNGARFDGVFGWLESDGIFPIAVPGSQLEVRPNDIRVVNSARLWNPNIGIDGSHLHEAAISDEGVFLFLASFTDGTNGVFEGSFAEFFRNFFPCVADFNEDDNVNTLDVLAFLNAWSTGDESADINGDGVVNTQDVLAFLNLWTQGCE